MKSFWKNKNVLITGINGFVGGNLAKHLLQEEANVFGLIRNNTEKSFIFYENLVKNINLIRGDITDYQLLRGLFAENKINTCFHLAAQVEVGVAKSFPYLTWETNVRGTYTLLEAIREAPYKLDSVIVASSDKSYGEYPSSKMPYQENYPLKPEYPYDTSKACTDYIAQSYSSNLYNIPIIITRFANIYGPGQLNFSALIPDSIRSALGYSNFIPRGDGNSVRDFLYVDDVCNLYLLLACELSKSYDLSGQIFNAGTNSYHKVKDIIKQIFYSLNQLEEYEKIKKQFSGKSSKGEIDIQYMNFDKLNKLFNWSPVTNFDDGINKTISWFKDYLLKN